MNNPDIALRLAVELDEDYAFTSALMRDYPLEEEED